MLKLNNKRIITASMLIIGILASGWGIKIVYGFIDNMRNEKNNIEQEIEKQNKLLEELANIQQPTGIEAGESEMEKLMIALPDNDELSNLIDQLDLLAKQNALFLTNISPVAGKEIGMGTEHNIKSKSVRIKLLGLYDNFQEFVRALEQSSRFINIDVITITQENDRALQAFDIGLIIYYYF